MEVLNQTGWINKFQKVREQTLKLCSQLSEEDCLVQSMEHASPVKWHLAHTTWFFEYFILEKFEKDFKPHCEDYKFLYNSYYENLGSKFPRPMRGLLTRPSLKEVKEYRTAVEDRIIHLLKGDVNSEAIKVLEIGLNHELQHQELIMTDIKHLFFQNPLRPSVMDELKRTQVTDQNRWITFGEGLTEVGYSGHDFFYDNEAPAHRLWLSPYQMAAGLVTNREYLDFINKGGYKNPEYWLADGWQWINANHISVPLYWLKNQNEWQEYTLNGLQNIDLDAPVCHISFYEADAFARSVNARLPTEFEWESFARKNSDVKNIFGTVWQWTSSSYAPYPGYKADDGALGEYNGKFMVNQYVLRGSSVVTPAGHSRVTYRNFFPPASQWQFSGVRLAKSL